MSHGYCGEAISRHTAHEWRVERALSDGATGLTRFRTITDSRVVAFSGESGFSCVHDRDAARRTKRHDLSIIFAASGTMNLDIAGRSVELSSGMFTITDSTLPMMLDVPSSFRHVYFIFPKQRVLSIFPFAEEFVGVPFGADQSLLSFFIDHLSSVEHHLGTFDELHANTVMKVTLDLLAMSLVSLDSGRMLNPRDRQLAQIKSFIEARLGDPELDLEMIAAASNINVRYLHKIFAATDSTVSNWIRKRRLEMCQRDFDATALAQRNITEVALRWGFNDMSHFSKAFKKEFGMAPREYRSRSRH